MAQGYEREIEDLREDVGAARSQSGATVLLGAGASKSAGIPLADGFCELIEERFPRKYKMAGRHGGTGYQNVMAQLPPDLRRQILTDAIDAALVNWAHIALACLVRDGYVTRILTPNFDPLIPQACALLNTFPSVYDFAASPAFDPTRVSSPAVYYLHGQRAGFRLLNTEDECEIHASSLEPVLDEAIAGRPLLVVGYSGRADPIFDRLLKDRAFGRGMYWVSHRDDDPGGHLMNGFLDAAQSRYLVPGHDADSFFIRLATQLDCFPPDLVREPFAHLQATYNQIVVDFPTAEGAPREDLLKQARAKVRAAAEWDDSRSAENSGADSLTELHLALAAGEYDSVIAAWKAAEDPSDELRHLTAWALSEQGADLTQSARNKTDVGDARASFEAAIEKYAAAVEVKPDHDTALNNWGVALADIAERATDVVGARAGFEVAIEKYAAAIEVNPDEHDALYNWGNALLGIAEHTEDAPAVRASFEAAIEKYAAAVEVNPDMHEALDNWGTVLLKILALETDKDRILVLYDQIEDVLLRAVRLDPAKTYNLACLYALQGRSDEAHGLLIRARDAGTLPDAEHLRVDTDLDGVRDEPWFADLLSDADG